MSSHYRSLDDRQKALVVVAVLLDGHEAPSFLENDAVVGEALSRAAVELAELPPDLRMPLVGTLLRESLQGVKK